MTLDELRLGVRALAQPDIQDELERQIRRLELAAEVAKVWTFTLQHAFGPRFCISFQMQERVEP